MYQDARGNTPTPGMGVCLTGPPTEPVVRERIETIVQRIRLCVSHANQIEGKIFNPIPQETGKNQGGQSTVENLLCWLNELANELEETLSRVNSKL